MVLRAVLVLAATALGAAGCGTQHTDGGGEPPAAEAAVKESEPTVAGDPVRPAAKRGATLKVVSSEFGRVIADRRGEALYLFDKEAGTRSRCYGACAVAWPPVLSEGKPRAGRGVDSDRLGTTKRRNGRRQLTYNGHPLYYYRHDEPGRILCHNVDEFGGLWLVVDRHGDAVG